ncbi:hypothetical protein CAI21_03925 [Alkalilimnicola ehrlichii]|uniref:Divergent polysaccharide deacetylase family protein n=1 Tax=Alkalilimnicola ehrlichii TaxID=351052 RepID=A0A3E0X236_9GAMM|nr:divergent polysaccharide deacetylase family protein [Alkalilimnicola ehrlichii]RFA30674.1 hypothetical protein CAI21_03925 [Alkalilimnicola ehrlichii]RFA38253.1 hypothetical protein CAL65_05295 [Alkalilimnicola ehrlichii]
MRWWFGVLVSAVFVCSAAQAESVSPEPAIAIIIDDLGDRLAEGRRVVDLPGPVACAFLPHTPHVQRLAEAAHATGKEVMLHLPLQAKAGNDLGPGGLTLDMDQEAFVASVQASLAAVPHVSGVNNHMGSLLTRHPGHMTWLMEVLRAQEAELFFIDSRTSRHSVAEQMAREARLPTASRHVFLDHNPSPRAVEAEFERLLRIARSRGVALAIGHPYRSTLEVLERRLPQLQEDGVRLVSVSEMIELETERDKSWQTSSSH